MREIYRKKCMVLLCILAGLLFVSGELFAYTAPTALQVLWTGTDQTPTCHQYGDYIDNVVLTGPNPSTTTLISNNTSAHPVGWHYDYGRSPQIPVGEVIKGQTYSISITVAGDDLDLQYLAVYVDWNQDNENGISNGTLMDTQENPLTWYSYASGPGIITLTGTISVPLWAASGYTYLRVMLDADSGGVNGGGYISAVGFGEFEDYVLNVSTGTSVPVVTTAAASLITTTSATLGGNVTDDGGASVDENGIVYSTSDLTPTVGEGTVTKVPIGTTTGAFSQLVGSLNPGTTYYFNAYGHNSVGYGYGTASSFLTLAPSVTSSTYDAATGVLLLTCTNITAGDDISPAKITLTGEGGTTYNLTTATVTASSSTSVSITLNATDWAAVNQILNKNGTSSTGATTYNLAAAEDWDASVLNGNSADLTGNGITVSNVAVPAITSATYNAATGALVVTGTGFLKLNGAINDIDVSKLTLVGEGGSTYTLTASSVEITSGTSFTATLNAPDLAAVNQILNKNGTSSTGATTYNLAAAEDWASGADVAVVVADLSGNGVTVSNAAVPTITSATYDASTGALVVTGTGFLKLNGATNDIDVSKLTLTGEGGQPYTLTSASVEITSGTSYTVTLNATDLATVNQILNKNGTSSTGSTTYNLAAAEDWASGADVAVVVADLTGNGVTVSNVAAPTITSATYDAATGALVVTGIGFLKRSGPTNDIDVSKLTLTGEGGATYTLTSGSVEIISGTSYTVTLDPTDLAAVNQILNKNGTSSTGATTYNLAAAEDWTSGADVAVVVADLTGNGVTVSNVAVPAITSATYNAATGALVVTGTGFLKLNGATNDINVTKLTLAGEGGSTYTLTTSSVEITSGTSFTVTLNATDLAAVNQILNKNGTSSTGATTYNLAAAEDWTSGADVAVVVADLTGNGVTVSNVAVPAITSATYNAATGALVVTGTGFLKLNGATNDINVTKLTLAGEGGSTYTLTTSSVEITSGTSFTVTLNATDLAAVNQILNKNGTSSTGATTYNLAAAEDWASGADVAVVVADLTGNGVTVSNVAVPTITSATYDAATGELVVTGTGFLKLSGASNDIDVSKLTLTGEGGATYTLTSASVEITSGTSFTVTLNAPDKSAIAIILNKDGTSSNDATTYNLAGAEDWASGANTATFVADLTGNGITVSNFGVSVTSVSVPASATYSDGQNLDFTIIFNDVINVTGIPQLSLTIGSSTKQAVYTSGSGTTSLVFRYTIQLGDLDSNGITVGALTANGGTLQNASLINAILTLNSVGNTNGVLVDAVAPSVVGVSSSTANGTYKAGDAISIQVNFSEPVTVTGIPQLTLETGTTDQVINYSSGSGTSALTFSYTIQSGDGSVDLDCQTATALALNGGSIKDAVNYNAVLTLPTPGAANSLGSNKNIVIDTNAPLVNSVSSTTANGAYKQADVISVTISFSEAVVVTGTPTLALNSGGSASYTSGSGTATLTFTYTVGAVQSNSDLDYSATNSLALAGGTVKDLAGNDAVLTLPTVGGVNSLGGQKDIEIAIAATVTTQAVSDISLKTATGNGNLTVLGVPNPTAYGVCWNTTGTPTIADAKVDKGGATVTGAFTANMTSLNMNTKYYVRAFATNTAGTVYGAEVNFTTLVATVPDSPTGIAASSDDGSARIYFTAPASDGGSPVTIYTVTSNPEGKTATRTSSPINITGLTNGMSYSFTVTATNGAGTSLPSSASNVVKVARIPDRPTNVMAIAGSGQAKVSFDVPTFDGGSSIFSYTVTSNPGGISQNGTSSPITVAGLNNGVSYTFTVVATNPIGNSYSSIASATVIPATVPGAPSSVAVASGDKEALVSFVAPTSDGGSAITKYTVTSSPEGLVGTGTSSPIKVAGLTNGVTYTFTVSAANVMGSGEASLASAPTTPFALTTTWNGTGTWDDISKWSNGLPGLGTGVIIEGSIMINSNVSVSDLLIQANSTLVVSADKKLTVNKAVKNYGIINNIGMISGVVLVPIVYEENGGPEVVDSLKVYGSKVILPPLTRTGYILKGWFVDKELTQAYVTALMPINRLTLYAKWELSTGVPELDLATLKLNPNPTTNGFTVNVGDKATQLTIFSMDGGKVISKQVAGNDYVDVSILVPGVYLVRIGDQSCKLIKR